MYEIVFKIVYFVIVLPVLIFFEGWDRFKKFMKKGNRWQYFPYFLLAALIVLLIILLLNGYR